MNKNSDVTKACEFCRFAAEIKTTDDMICSHKGVVNREYSCRKFVYDPLKRVPRKLPELPTLEEI